MKADTDILNQEQVAEIEARANDASPTYCVNWEKGGHALLQASGWRPAHEEQPRTIATFDRDEGYVDLLFCAEARTDIPALCRTVRAAWSNEIRLAKEVVDLREQLAQPVSVDVLRRQVDACAELQSQLAQIEQERNSLRGQVVGLNTRLAQVEKERDWFSKQCENL